MDTLAIPKFSWISAVILIAIFLVGYIFQVAKITEAGFFISNYEKKIIELVRESKILESNFSQFNSLANLETILNNLSYEKVEKIHYLRVPGSQVVAKPSSL